MEEKARKDRRKARMQRPIYRINQLIDEAKHTKMKTYTAEEYKEKIAKEKQEK